MARLIVEMDAKQRDVLLSLVQAAKDDCSASLKVFCDPNNYSTRSVEVMRKVLEVYVGVEERLREAKWTGQEGE